MLGNTNSDKIRDRKIEDLVNKTSSIVSKLENNNVNSAIQEITDKILHELKFDNESRLDHVQSTLKEGLKENANSLHQLEKQIADLKDEKGDSNMGFNKTASFKFEEFGRGSNNNNASLINQLESSNAKPDSKNSRNRNNSFNQRNDSENSTLKRIPTKEQQRKLDVLKKKLANYEVSNTE